MVRNADLCDAFKALCSADRIDLMCGLLQLCHPLELRFVGACLEELARKDYARLKDFETKANDYAVLRETRIDELTRDACGTVVVYLSLLHSDNSFCAHALFDLVAGIKRLVDAAVGRTTVEEGEEDDGRRSPPLDLDLAVDLILLFTMALHHPAFAFNQRFQLYSEYVNLKNLLSDFVGCIPLKNGDLTEEKSVNSAKNEVDDDEDGSSKSAKNSVQNSTLRDAEVESACLKEITLKSTTSTEGRTEFLFEIIWSDASVTNVVKTYPELSEFHRQCVHQFPHYSGVHKQERLLPFFPQENNERMVELLKEYFRKFSSLPECCLKCHLVMDFFHDRNSVSSSSSSASSASSSSALILVVSVVPVTQTTVTITSSTSQMNFSSRNCAESSGSMFSSEPEADHRGNRIRSITVYNSQLQSSGEHGPKRGGDLAGKPIRPRQTTVGKAPVVTMPPPFVPVLRQPWLVSQASAVGALQQTRLCDSTVGCPTVCLSPCLSVTSMCTSPQSPSISPPQSATSSSSTEVTQSHSSVSETSIKQKRFNKHHDNLSANSCHRLQTTDQDEEQHLLQHNMSLHRSKSEQDHRRGISNGVASAAASFTDRQSVTWCVQNFQVQEPTPLILNTPMPMVISNNIPKGLTLGLHPVAMQDQEQLDVNDQDKMITDDLYSAVSNDKLSMVYGSQQLNLNPGTETPVFLPGFSPAAAGASVRTLPIAPYYFISTPMIKPGGAAFSVATQAQTTAAKPARAILGASHHRVSSKMSHQLENGEKRSIATTQEISITAAMTTVTTAVVAVAAQSTIACDSNMELVGHSNPVLVSSESVLSRPSSLNVSSMTLHQRPKIMNNDLKGGKGSNFVKISASRSVATVSASVDARGMTGYYPDVPTTNSSPFPPPGSMMIQRIQSMSAGTQPFPIQPIPPPISSLPVIHGTPPMTSAVLTPSTTPPVMPVPPANLTNYGGPCTSCCHCSLSAMPYTIPFMWSPSHLYQCTVNGFINPQNLSYPPPSLPPHVPLGGTFNGMNSDMVYNIAQPQVPPPPPPIPHLNHPSVMNSPLFTASQCVPFHQNFMPPVHIHNPASAVKPKQCCPNCGSSDHVLGSCTETKASVLNQTAQFRLNPGTKQPSE